MSIYKERVDGVSKYDLQKTLPFPFCVCSFFKGGGDQVGVNLKVAIERNRREKQGKHFCFLFQEEIVREWEES